MSSAVVNAPASWYCIPSATQAIACGWLAASVSKFAPGEAALGRGVELDDHVPEASPTDARPEHNVRRGGPTSDRVAHCVGARRLGVCASAARRWSCPELVAGQGRHARVRDLAGAD